jgi:hypothetical protein
MVCEVSNRYAQSVATEAERKTYFDALHQEIKNGGLEAMLYDMLYWNLGDWHPREIPQTEGLQRQKQQSMKGLEQWFTEILQNGSLPRGSFRSKDATYNFATTRILVDDAKHRLPRRLHEQIGDKTMGDFLREQGCTPRRRGDRGWIFPPLAELRANWEKRAFAPPRTTTACRQSWSG